MAPQSCSVASATHAKLIIIESGCDLFRSRHSKPDIPTYSCHSLARLSGETNSARQLYLAHASAQRWRLARYSGSAAGNTIPLVLERFLGLSPSMVSGLVEEIGGPWQRGMTCVRRNRAKGRGSRWTECIVRSPYLYGPEDYRWDGLLRVRLICKETSDCRLLTSEKRGFKMHLGSISVWADRYQCRRLASKSDCPLKKRCLCWLMKCRVNH
jgi:hypothetical protein